MESIDTCCLCILPCFWLVDKSVAEATIPIRWLQKSKVLYVHIKIILIHIIHLQNFCKICMIFTIAFLTVTVSRSFVFIPYIRTSVWLTKVHPTTSGAGVADIKVIGFLQMNPSAGFWQIASFHWPFCDRKNSTYIKECKISKLYVHRKVHYHLHFYLFNLHYSD